MSNPTNLRNWPAEDLLILARAAGMLWDSTGRSDPYDVLSERQRQLLDLAAVSYLTAEQGGLDASGDSSANLEVPGNYAGDTLGHGQTIASTRALPSQHRAQPKQGTVFDRDDNPVTRGSEPGQYPLYGSCETCGQPARCLDITADWGHDTEWPDRYRYCHPVTPFERWLIRQARLWIADSFGDVDVALLDDSDVETGVVLHYSGGWAAFMATELGIPARFPATAYVRNAAGDLAHSFLLYSREQWIWLAARQPAGFEVQSS